MWFVVFVANSRRWRTVLVHQLTESVLVRERWIMMINMPTTIPTIKSLVEFYQRKSNRYEELHREQGNINKKIIDKWVEDFRKRMKKFDEIDV